MESREGGAIVRAQTAAAASESGVGRVFFRYSDDKERMPVLRLLTQSRAGREPVNESG